MTAISQIVIPEAIDIRTIVQNTEMFKGHTHAYVVPIVYV